MSLPRSVRTLLRTAAPAAALLLVLAVGGCGSDDDGGSSAPPPPLDGTSWRLDGDAVAVAGAGTVTATLAFGEGARVTGQDGCNALMGPYKADGSALTFGPLAGTQKACGAPADLVAAKVRAGLAATRTYAVDGDRLLLRDAGGATVLTYVSYTPSVSGRWDVVNVLYDDGIHSVVTGTAPTAVFGDDGRISGATGCNDFTGAYVVDGASLTIERVAATRRACVDDTGAVQAQESGYLAALESVRSFRQAGDELTLLDDQDRMAVVLRRAGP